MGQFLSKNQIVELKAEHRVEDHARYADRIKAILLLDAGLSSAKVAEYLLLDEKTVRNYRRMYDEGGIEELCTDEYSGSKSLLTEVQLDELEKELRGKIYLTTAAVVGYVKSQFGVSYSLRGMTSLMHRIGFSYKKPRVIPGKANAQAQTEFLADLEELKSNKKAENPIYYMDGVHPQHNSHPAHGWFPKGEETNLKTNTGRQRVTLNGALNSETHQIIVQEDLTLNADNTIAFFNKIEAAHPSADTIYVILDNAGYYKGVRIQTYLATSKIVLLYLPPYAPNLNLIERVWKFFKKKVLANRYYESFLEFRTVCLDFFSENNWRSLRPELRSLLSNNFQIVLA